MLTKAPLAALGAALVAGYFLAHLSPPAALAQSTTKKWEHFCFVKKAGTDELTTDANISGRQGWELVSVNAVSDGGPTMMCFKRPLP